MKFDAIVGNPPYQEDTGGGSAANVAAKQARPVYNLFVDQAKTMQPHYISMIMPARWYAGGIGLNDFRNEMLNDPHLIRLTDFVNSKDCFSTVDIAGGAFAISCGIGTRRRSARLQTSAVWNAIPCGATSMSLGKSSFGRMNHCPSSIRF